MDKKDIYEHLAKIYLDASQKKGKKSKPATKLFKNLFLVSITLIFLLSGLLVSDIYKFKSLKSETSLVLLADAAKLNFNFDPATKEIYALNLKGLDITRFKSLGFALKKSQFSDKISVRVEFVNAYNERSEIYVKDISTKWIAHRFKLSDFKKISDWSGMLALNFVVEEWNAVGKKGMVFVDNVSLIK
jgi:hypothetical protein